MVTPLAEAHVRAQARLRAIAATAVTTAWTNLGSYDERDVDPFLSVVLPTMDAVERQSVGLTDAFLGQAVGRPPLGVDPDQVIAEEVRPGVDPAEVYRRSFVTVWTALKAGTDYEAAVGAGLARLRGTARTDVQLAMRGTLRQVGEADKLILGYQRVPNASACRLCQLAAGQRYKVGFLFPIHDGCGCGVDVITGPERPNFTGRYDNDPVIEGAGIAAAIREHGELGPVLVNAAHHFSEVTT